MTVEQADMKLDGNAIGGLLAEIFNMEMTSAEGTCGGCGAVNAVARVLVWRVTRRTAGVGMAA